MPKFSTLEIIERRNKVQRLLSQGSTLEDISKELKVSYETIKNDKKHLKKEAFEMLTNSRSEELAYQYCTMIQNILNCNKKCWEIFNDESSSPKIKLQALKTSVECNRELNQLVKDSTSVFTLENLKKRIDDLAASLDNETVKSYMTIPMPSLIHSQSEVLDLPK